MVLVKAMMVIPFDFFTTVIIANIIEIHWRWTFAHELRPTDQFREATEESPASGNHFKLSTSWFQRQDLDIKAKKSHYNVNLSPGIIQFPMIACTQTYISLPF